MYTFLAFVFMIYNENHHPYLLVFMSLATLAISVGAWYFLRCSSLECRAASLMGGFLASYIIGEIC
jgi:hypothetical protein